MTTASIADAQEIAEILSVLTGAEAVPVDGGFRVKETETHWVDVNRMIFNWRVARMPKAEERSYDRHWCFAGTGFPALVRAVQAAVEWDGGDRTEPEGWNKNGQTGEWRGSRMTTAPDGTRESCDCRTCQDACTRKPGWFLPGEAEIAAESLGMTLPEFFAKYLFFEGGRCRIHLVKPHECRVEWHGDHADGYSHEAVAMAWKEHQGQVTELLGREPEAAPWRGGGLLGFFDAMGL